MEPGIAILFNRAFTRPTNDGDRSTAEDIVLVLIDFAPDPSANKGLDYFVIRSKCSFLITILTDICGNVPTENVNIHFVCYI